jgi:hypothetical protein
MNPGSPCGRRVGFLFPHPCDRMTPEGCPDCQNGEVGDPYRDRLDRGVYTDYDDYDSGYVGKIAGAEAGMRFTQGDGENLVKRRKPFEEDPTAS